MHVNSCLASTRVPTRLGRVAEANYVISTFFQSQTRKKCANYRFLGHYYKSLRIDCRHTWECPRNQSGRAQNAAENADSSRTARTHLGCPDDVRTTMQTSCRRCQEAHFCIQILIETKIWTRTFCPLPKVQKRREVFRNDKDSERNLSRVCEEVAE